MNQQIVAFAAAIFALPAFGLLAGIGATLASGATKRRWNTNGLRAAIATDSRPLIVDLPTEMEEMLNAKVASGEYASLNAAIVESLRALIGRNSGMDK